jgi:guanylate kinase
MADINVVNCPLKKAGIMAGKKIKLLVLSGPTGSGKSGDRQR